MNLKAVDPKEKPKLIALIVVAIIIFGFSGFQILTYNSAQGKLVSAAKAEAAAKQQAAATPTALTAPSAAEPRVATVLPGSLSTPSGAPASSVPTHLHGQRPTMSPSIAPTTPPAALVASTSPTPGASAAATPGAAHPGTPIAIPTPAVSGVAGIAGIPVVATQTQIAMGPPVRGKDPFLPTGRFAEPAKPTPAPSPALPAVKQGLNVPNFNDMPIVTETTHSGTSPVVAAIPTPAPATPTPAPVLLPPPYTVTGVVVADRDNPRAVPIAVLRSSGPIGAPNAGPVGVAPGSGKTTTTLGGAPATQVDRRFVTIGDPVGNGFVVAAVHADGVVLRSGKRLVILKIGMANGNLK